MPAEVRIPTLGESISEGVIVRWLKASGDAVQTDEALFELETDKASVEIPAPSAGVIEILKPEGATVKVGEVVARLTDGDGAKAKKTPTAAEKAPVAEPKAEPATTSTEEALSPAVRRLVEEHKLDPAAIHGTGRGGRLTKEDVLGHIERQGAAAPAVSSPSPPPAMVEPPPVATVSERSHPLSTPAADQERVPMTRLRQRIAERLVQAQHTAAILTTFNEVDMTAVMDLRAKYKERFAKAHGVNLGFMSFFVRACIAALKEVPQVNAYIDGSDVVYNKHVHLGVAVGTERGLVVPIVHYADQMSFAEIEKEIERLAGLARENKLAIENISGGTFTISNGGVYGSLMSTPILNPPQSGILGMHKIEKRPVVVDDQIVIRPMMYLAVSYDHRLIDGGGAVTFLVKIKERIEDPGRLLLEV